MNVKKELVLLKNKSWPCLKISLHKLLWKMIIQADKSTAISNQNQQKDTQLPQGVSVSLRCDIGY